ncbi:hypothetical protein QFC20_005423 [Naganishia adeliensis]|uniref:Uncharacterized protein n=1 Tax=Naganishia adeliensis TaxID=92952 RepID=A0ACC2VM36_9TREE|nr:hypothetical protein QFC20_005423 [Naganishia adeliensis]
MSAFPYCSLREWDSQAEFVRGKNIKLETVLQGGGPWYILEDLRKVDNVEKVSPKTASVPVEVLTRDAYRKPIGVNEDFLKGVKFPNPYKYGVAAIDDNTLERGRMLVWLGQKEEDQTRIRDVLRKAFIYVQVDTPRTGTCRTTSEVPPPVAPPFLCE